MLQASADQWVTGVVYRSVYPSQSLEYQDWDHLQLLVEAQLEQHKPRLAGTEENTQNSHTLLCTWVHAGTKYSPSWKKQFILAHVSVLSLGLQCWIAWQRNSALSLLSGNQEQERKQEGRWVNRSCPHWPAFSNQIGPSNSKSVVSPQKPVTFQNPHIWVHNILQEHLDINHNIIRV